MSRDEGFRSLSLLFHINKDFLMNHDDQEESQEWLSDRHGEQNATTDDNKKAD